MTTGPRPTPYPIVLQVDASGTPTGLGESSSIYVLNVSAVTISATNYLGLGSLSGFPGGSVGDVQVKSGNTTFAGYTGLKYDTGLSALLANVVSASNYLNLPSRGLSSLSDVQISSVSGGQALIYSSSINKWAPGYTIYRSDSNPVNSVGISGDIYLQYTDSLNNDAYLSSLLDTDINAVSNGQSLIWSNGYWIPSSLPTATPGAITNIPSASPIWNAASAEGYDIQWGVVGGFTPAAFDILGFSFQNPIKITNYRASDAGPLLVNQARLSNLNDINVLTAQPNNLLSYNGVNWINTSSVILNSVSATNWRGLPSATPAWNANKLQNYSVSISNPQLYDVFAVSAGNTIVNVSSSVMAQHLASLVGLSALQDVWDSTPAQQNNVLIRNQGYWEPSNSISLANVSATTFTLFTKNTSSTGVPTENNQAITYDSSNQKWKPGYAVYQATGIPSNTMGRNGDIYFQYLP